VPAPRASTTPEVPGSVVRAGTGLVCQRGDEVLGIEAVQLATEPQPGPGVVAGEGHWIKAGRRPPHLRPDSLPPFGPGRPARRLLACRRPARPDSIAGGFAPRSKGVERPAQELAHPAEAPLLPLEDRAAGQGHPRPSNPREHRMKNAHWPDHDN
jgi:hypothetical protein